MARIGYNVGNVKGYTGSDLEGGPPRLGVGASVQADFDADWDDYGMLRGKWMRFSSGNISLRRRDGTL
ncbi:MAG: hypothetical protein JXX29_16450 [Deltaproteobacteria bacterium]|nr:hypothetical protein [Deltaproteobacteria bacterium]MBN2673275.1 hypothetical protein [Deltaproteobacteria bacterium]